VFVEKNGEKVNRGDGWFFAPHSLMVGRNRQMSTRALTNSSRLEKDGHRGRDRKRFGERKRTLCRAGPFSWDRRCRAFEKRTRGVSTLKQSPRTSKIQRAVLLVSRAEVKRGGRKTHAGGERGKPEAPRNQQTASGSLWRGPGRRGKGVL